MEAAPWPRARRREGSPVATVERTSGVALRACNKTPSAPVGWVPSGGSLNASDLSRDRSAVASAGANRVMKFGHIQGQGSIQSTERALGGERVLSRSGAKIMANSPCGRDEHLENDSYKWRSGVGCRGTQNRSWARNPIAPGATPSSNTCADGGLGAAYRTRSGLIAAPIAAPAPAPRQAEKGATKNSR